MVTTSDKEWIKEVLVKIDLQKGPAYDALRGKENNDSGCPHWSTTVLFTFVDKGRQHIQHQGQGLPQATSKCTRRHIRTMTAELRIYFVGISAE